MSGYVIVVSAVRTTYKPSRFMKTKSKKEAASIGTSLKKKSQLEYPLLQNPVSCHHFDLNLIYKVMHNPEF